MYCYLEGMRGRAGRHLQVELTPQQLHVTDHKPQKQCACVCVCVCVCIALQLPLLRRTGEGRKAKRALL